MGNCHERMDSSMRLAREAVSIQELESFIYELKGCLMTSQVDDGFKAAIAYQAALEINDRVAALTFAPPDGYFKGHAIYGGMILIEHADGWRSLYAHLHSTRVHTGQRVRAGQVIGRVGSTGMSRGAHLHVELHDSEGKQVNPLLHLSAQR